MHKRREQQHIRMRREHDRLPKRFQHFHIIQRHEPSTSTCTNSSIGRVIPSNIHSNWRASHRHLHPRRLLHRRSNGRLSNRHRPTTANSARNNVHTSPERTQEIRPRQAETNVQTAGRYPGRGLHTNTSTTRQRTSNANIRVEPLFARLSCD